jgi:hypothetical protein
MWLVFLSLSYLAAADDSVSADQPGRAKALETVHIAAAHGTTATVASALPAPDSGQHNQPASTHVILSLASSYRRGRTLVTPRPEMLADHGENASPSWLHLSQAGGPRHDFKFEDRIQSDDIWQG